MYSIKNLFIKMLTTLVFVSGITNPIFSQPSSGKYLILNGNGDFLSCAAHKCGHGYNVQWVEKEHLGKFEKKGDGWTTHFDLQKLPNGKYIIARYTNAHNGDFLAVSATKFEQGHKAQWGDAKYYDKFIDKFRDSTHLTLDEIEKGKFIIATGIGDFLASTKKESGHGHFAQWVEGKYRDNFMNDKKLAKSCILVFREIINPCHNEIRKLKGSCESVQRSNEILDRSNKSLQSQNESLIDKNKIFQSTVTTLEHEKNELAIKNRYLMNSIATIAGTSLVGGAYMMLKNNAFLPDISSALYGLSSNTVIVCTAMVCTTVFKCMDRGCCVAEAGLDVADQRTKQLLLIFDNKFDILIKVVDGRLEQLIGITDERAKQIIELVEEAVGKLDDQCGQLIKVMENGSDKIIKVVDKKSEKIIKVVDGEVHKVIDVVDNRSKEANNILDRSAEQCAGAVECVGVASAAVLCPPVAAVYVGNKIFNCALDAFNKKKHD